MLREKITAEYLEQIFRENYSRYYYYALSVVDESEVAKDIIGEVFLAVWKNRADIDEKKLNSYIFTSIRNKSLNEISKSHDFVPVETNEARLSADSGEEWLQKEERIIEMEKVIATMNPRTRYILEQFYYQHRSYKEVAEELGITTEGIKKQLVKAMMLFREHFNINKHKK